MSFIVYVILIALGGLVVGALARLALPGKDPMTLGQTMLVGIGGSLRGRPARLTRSVDAGPGFALAVLFATLIVYFVRRSRGGVADRPRPPAARPLARGSGAPARSSTTSSSAAKSCSPRPRSLGLGEDALGRPRSSRCARPPARASSRQRRTSFSMCSSLNSVV